MKQLFDNNRYTKTLKWANKQKDPNKITYLYIDNYHDTIFPNDELLKFARVEQIVLKAGPIFWKKGDPDINPFPLKIDSCKLKQLNELRYLSFSYFDFSNFPGELCFAENLVGLDVTTCAVEALPEEISNLKNLQILSAAVNYISDLPKSFAEMDSLKALYIPNNKFTSFPEILKDCKSLEYISISNREGPEILLQPISKYMVNVNKIKILEDYKQLHEILNNSKLERIEVAIEPFDPLLKSKLRSLIKDDELMKKVSY